MGILLAVANRKGGVGKSTVTSMLAHGFAVTGEQRVLVVDLDTQCNSSMILVGGEKWDWVRRNKKTIADFMDEKYDRLALRPDNYIIHNVGDVEAPLGRLSLLCGSLDLEDLESEIMHVRARSNASLAATEQAIVDKFRSILFELQAAFDVVIFDCPPGLSLSAKAALLAAHKVIVPFRPDFVSRYAVDRISTVIEEKTRFEEVLDVPAEKRRYTALVNFWRDGNFQRLNFGAVAAHHPVLHTAIPQDDGIAEAFEYRGEHLSLEEKYGSGAQIVRALCGEVVDSIILGYQREAA